jgi:hypothetical protein
VSRLPDLRLQNQRPSYSPAYWTEFARGIEAALISGIPGPLTSRTDGRRFSNLYLTPAVTCWTETPWLDRPFPLAGRTIYHRTWYSHEPSPYCGSLGRTLVTRFRGQDVKRVLAATISTMERESNQALLGSRKRPGHLSVSSNIRQTPPQVMCMMVPFQETSYGKPTG